MKKLFKNLLFGFLFIFIFAMMTACDSSSSSSTAKTSLKIEAAKYKVARLSVIEQENQIGDSLPSDYKDSFYLSYKLTKDVDYNIYTNGDIDTRIYVYINGALTYIEDDQINADGDIDNNARFTGSFKAGNKVVIVVTATQDGLTTIHHPKISF